MQKGNPKKQLVKKQEQRRPGLEYKMDPHPEFTLPGMGLGKLHGKKCLVTGGDSGIGRAVAIAFAGEGADVAIVFLKQEKKDAEFTARIIREEHRKACLLVPADLRSERQCVSAAKKILHQFGQVDVLVNNAAVHYPAKSITQITDQHLFDTFKVNLFSVFWMIKAVLPKMKKGSCIINTVSVVAYRGSPHLLDYSATKGALVSLTRSLSENLYKKNIRVNAVAPGPVWTPLIASSFDADKVAKFGSDNPMQRPAQPSEIAPAYVFLASQDASYINGQTIHVNGGEVVNG